MRSKWLDACAGLAAVMLCLAGCVGRLPSGGNGARGVETMGWDAPEGFFTPEVREDVLDAESWAEWVELEPWWDLDTVELDVPPEIEPVPCETDDDCPAVGAEPCYLAKCEFNEIGDRVCRAVSGLVCEASGPCVVAMCKPGVGCVEKPGKPGVACDDGNACSLGDQCKGGVCAGTPKICDDSNICTADQCDAATGQCFHMEIPAECQDGDPCTVGDHCQGGKCLGQPVNCDDYNPCTDDKCDSVVGCVSSVPPGKCLSEWDCDDKDACTKDLCSDCFCVHDKLSCDDGETCTLDSCKPASGCSHTKIPGCCHTEADCWNGDQCSVGKCQNQTCVYMPLPACNDSDVCTKDACDPAVGCVYSAIPGCCLSDAECVDGDWCTQDLCQANKCQHPAVKCVDTNPCTQDGCKSSIGCTFTPIAGCCLAVADCNDKNACTTETCTYQKCVYAPVACNDSDACTQDSCQPATGCTFSPIPGCCSKDKECDDGNVCTTDACKANKCVHTPVISPECCVINCKGKECGPDGCGGLCGQCPDGWYCGEDDFVCHDFCMPDCLGKECGPDGCGTFCGLCPEGKMCSDAGKCVSCIPKCAGKSCGPDGCGGSCGMCPVGQSCQSASGVCLNACNSCIGASCYQDGFESGELNGWSFDGDAEALHNMGATEAPQGWYMAFVGSGLSELELGKVEKAFCPPAKYKWFGFKWKHYSEEFIEWCGSVYQDTFLVTISNANKSVKLMELTVDQLCPPTACAGCGSKYVGLEEADVDFDYADVWTTPWQTSYFELPSGMAGGPVTVTFEVSDVGDMVYVTAILIDAVQFY